MRSIKSLRVMSRGVALALFLALVVPSIALASPTFPVNLSGTETSPISSLKIVKNPDGSSDVYGTTFAGWEGGGGPNATGWTAAPGLGGAWSLAANYHVAAGSKVGIGGSVTLHANETSWSLTLPNGYVFGGTVAGGTVTWPSTLTTDDGCGPGVAVISAQLNYGNSGAGSVTGCLDDQHLTTVFPPHLWGTFSAPASFAMPPTCSMTTAGTNSQGLPYLQTTDQDTASGLATIGLTSVTNASVDLPPYATGITTPTTVSLGASGTTSAVALTATALDASAPVSVSQQLSDLAGNLLGCDSTALTISRSTGKPVSQTLSGLPQGQSTLSLMNGTPGLTAVNVTVNGVEFDLEDLSSGSQTTLNVSSAMQAGNANTIVVTGVGKPGGSGVVVIWGSFSE